MTLRTKGVTRSLSNTSAACVTQVWLLSRVNDDVALDITRGRKPARNAKSSQETGDTGKTLITGTIQRRETTPPAWCGLLCV